MIFAQKPQKSNENYVNITGNTFEINGFFSINILKNIFQNVYNIFEKQIPFFRWV